MNNSEELPFENISVHLDLYVLMEVISGDPSVACISNKERLSCVSELINQAFQQKIEKRNRILLYLEIYFVDY
mgnify:CR=1 FL=1